MTLFACSRDSSNRAVAEAAWGSRDAHVPSIATRRPRSQAVRARSIPHFPFSFALKPCPSAPWAQGLLSAFWDQGCPDLPACGPRRGSTNGLVRPSFGRNSSRPSRGAEPREADDTKTSLGAASLGGLPRSGDIHARGTSRGSHDVSHDDQGQAGASGRSVPVSSLVLRRQAQARGPEASGNGFHIDATRPRPPGR